MARTSTVLFVCLCLAATVPARGQGFWGQGWGGQGRGSWGQGWGEQQAQPRYYRPVPRPVQPQAQPQNHQQNSHQEYAEKSHGKGERIPPQKFQTDFGRDHHFRVKHLEQGRRFEYSGYSFELVEAWPAGWSYEDECYIEQDADGYYLVDVIHPEVRVLVIVV